jgi:hypothetical protein
MILNLLSYTGSRCKLLPSNSMSEEIRDIKESISFLAETQRILSESMLLQQQQFNEFQQVLNNSLQESERRFNASQQEFERRFNASQERLEAILLNQQRQIQLSEDRIAKTIEQQQESDQRFNVLIQEIRHTNQRVDRIEQP